MGNKNREGFTELVITNIDPDLKSELKEKAKKKGETLSYLLRPLLREWVGKKD
jgi:hypothetical protein